MFYIEVFTGLRRGELLALEWSDIDFEKRSISVSKQVQRERGVEHGKLQIVTLKNRKPRTIYPPASVFPILETYRLFQDAYKRSAEYEGIE
jgi:integrase